MEGLQARITRALAERYRVDRQLGGGGMATVFLAEDLRYQHPVAIKVLHPELAEMVGTSRFLREIELTRGLNHNFIQMLHGSGEADGLPYYVMPVAGESLRDVLEREKQLSIEEAIRLTGEVAEALDHAHRNNVIHRDLKPENILIHEGHVRVADFGIARAIVEAGGEKLTATHTIVGTPAYMSPEQAAGERTVDGRSDVYSLACVLFEMLTGRPPYTGPAESLVFQHQSAPVPDPRSIRPSVPEAVARSVMRGLSKTPIERPENPGEFARSLAASAPVESRRAPSWKFVWAGLAAVGAVGAVAAILWVSGRDSTPADPDRIAVFPFSTQGSAEIAHVGDAVALLLPSSLDGIGRMQAVDPRALSEYLRSHADQPISTATALQTANHFGAVHFVRGDVIRVGSDVRIEAALYDASSGSEPKATAHIRGSPDSIGALVDRLAARIAVVLRPRAGAGVFRVAERTSPSAEALLHFVRGSTGPPSEAIPHFQRALEIDSTFALAAYRLGVSAQFAGSALADGPAYGRRMIAQAVRHSGGLPLQDQRRIRAGYAVVHGDVPRGMAILDSIVAEHPDDLSTLQHIAVLRRVMNPAYGRSFTEARQPIEQMFRLFPDSTSMLNMLRDIEHYEGNFEWAEYYSRKELSIAPRSLSVRVVHAMMFGDSHSVDSAAAMIRSRPPDMVNLFVRNMRDAGIPVDRLERFVSALNEPETHPVYERWLARLDVQRGRWRAARERLRLSRNHVDVILLARMSVAPHMPVTETWLDTVTVAVRGLPVNPDIVIQTEAGVPSPHVRAYLLGLLAIRRGDFKETERHTAQLDDLRSVGPPEARELAVDLAASLRAGARWAQGDPAAALAHIEAAPMRAWWGPTHSIRFRLHERYLRAELLYGLRRYGEALPWFESLRQGISDGALYDAIAHLRQAQIHEKLGNIDTATSHYNSFIELWADCDPELRPQVEAARARRQALMAGMG